MIRPIVIHYSVHRLIEQRQEAFSSLAMSGLLFT